MCFLATWVFSLEKHLFESFPHLKIVLFAFLLLNCKSSLYNLGTTLISYIICKYSLPLYGLFFHFLESILCSTQAFNFYDILLIYSFFLLLLMLYLGSYCLIHGYEDILLVISFKSLWFISMIHVELIFVYSVR